MLPWQARCSHALLSWRWATLCTLCRVSGHQCWTVCPEGRRPRWFRPMGLSSGHKPWWLYQSVPLVGTSSPGPRCQSRPLPPLVVDRRSLQLERRENITILSESFIVSQNHTMGKMDLAEIHWNVKLIQWVFALWITLRYSVPSITVISSYSSRRRKNAEVLHDRIIGEWFAHIASTVQVGCKCF